MIQALHFKNEKSDKFWFVEILDSEMMVNYGKTGTTGKYEIKEFDTNEDCEKEALKLINSKKKKGYEEFPEFDRNNRYYFDDEELWMRWEEMSPHDCFRFPTPPSGAGNAAASQQCPAELYDDRSEEL